MQEFKREGIFFCLVGPAGSGKSTIAEKLLAVHAGTLFQSISYTTRTIRPNEIEGKSYHFVERDKFQKMRENGLFSNQKKFMESSTGPYKKM